MGKEAKFDLEDRLVDFAAMILTIAEQLPRTLAGSHIAGQIVRSGTSPAANYGEVQGAESRKDFIHKFGIVLKELKETRIWLRIICKKKYLDVADVDSVFIECCELIQISGKSISTARKNNER
ncbi:MAG: four helix bundle protein [Kiritimatiellales bacterium]